MTWISEGSCIFDKEEWRVLGAELSLSPRQHQIVQYLFLGKSDKQIARELDLALPTVRTHLGRLFAKLNVQDRHELILYIFHHFRHGNTSLRDRNGSFENSGPARQSGQ